MKQVVKLYIARQSATDEINKEIEGGLRVISINPFVDPIGTSYILVLFEEVK